MANVLFKKYVNSYGKELETQIVIDGTTYKAADVVSVNPHYNGKLYSSVMKELDLELMGEHSLKGKTISSLKIGVRTGTLAYQYQSFGSYIVKECEYDVATKSTKCECYDKMLEAMIPYDTTFEYPITVGAFLQGICNRFEWTLATTEFCNSTVEIEEEKFNDSYTFRDVLDQIAQLSGGLIGFKSDGKLYVIYPTESGETIDESNLKSLTIGEKYGPVNSLVLARTPQEDNIYAQDPESVEADGLCEVKIENNQIMDSHRDDFIENLLAKIKGTTYYLYELESFGIGYLELGDIFTIKVEDGTEYKTIMLNDDFKVTQGMSETSSLAMPEETKTDYSAASKTDRLINQTLLKVNKQENTITALVTETTNLQSSLDGIESAVGTLKTSVEQTMTSTEVETLISETVKQGTTEVTTTTGFKFNKDGLEISKSNSDISTVINEDGMDISKEGEVVLAADSTGVNALNLTARQYLIVGTNSRFEDYTNSNGDSRTGCFFIGG